MISGSATGSEGWSGVVVGAVKINTGIRTGFCAEGPHGVLKGVLGVVGAVPGAGKVALAIPEERGSNSHVINTLESDSNSVGTLIVGLIACGRGLSA